MDSSSSKERSSKSPGGSYGKTQNRFLVRKLFKKCNALVGKYLLSESPHRIKNKRTVKSKVNKKFLQESNLRNPSMVYPKVLSCLPIATTAVIFHLYPLSLSVLRFSYGHQPSARGRVPVNAYALSPLSLSYFGSLGAPRRS
jgi:hypothetical protein